MEPIPIPIPTANPSPNTSSEQITFVCISDTHSQNEEVILPPGDVLLHAGDFTLYGHPEEVDAFNSWIGKQNFKYKIVIAGNHEHPFDLRNYDKFLSAKFHGKTGKFPYPKPINAREVKDKLTDCIYLEDSGCEVLGYRIYGSPWTPTFHNWAFNLEAGKRIREMWRKIPTNTDILITHGPPYGILDKCENGVMAGCKGLLREIKGRIRPKVHLFGHIHEKHGVYEEGGTTYINASICTKLKQPLNQPVVFKLPKKTQA